MASLLQDLKHASRALLNHPGYLVTALLTLALGIGFTTAIFTVVNAVLLRPLPYSDPDRLVRLLERNPPRFPQFSVSPGHYLFWTEQATAFEGIGAWTSRNLNLDIGSDDPQRVQGLRVSTNLFPLLGVAPVVGRTFTDAEGTSQASAVALLSYGTWQRRFGGRADTVGRTIRLDGQPVTIIGVMPESLRFPSRETEIWVPLALSPEEQSAFGSHFLGAVGRLKPGITREQAARDMEAVSRRLEEFNPPSAGWSVLLFDLHAFTVEGVRASLVILLAAVTLVLLIACANVANLLLARGASRHKELAIRSSIGASRARLLRQLLVEHVVLASVSALAGVILAAWLLRILLAMVPDALPATTSVTLDRQVLAFALGLALLTPLLFGLLPAIQGSRPDLRAVIATGGRQGSGGPAARTRTALVVAEIALAMTLLVGAGLLIRSFTNLIDQSPGFEPAQAIHAELSLPIERYPRGEARERVIANLLAGVAAAPGVEAVGLTMPMPMISDFNSSFEVEGAEMPPEARPLTLFYAVSPGYFAAMGIPIVKGRAITAEDRRDGPRTVVISQALAETHFRGVDPIGRRLRVTQGDDEWREIVGVAGNVKHAGLDERPRASVYEGYSQHPYFSAFSLVVRTTSDDPAAIVPGVRAVLRGLDREIPLARVRTLEGLVDATTRDKKFSTALIAVFGAAALLLASVGVYGVMAYTVGLRRQEFAIRVVHGAQRKDILRLVLQGSAVTALAGIAIGTVAVRLVGGMLQGLLFNISAADLPTYVCGALILGGSAMAASALPALRATRADPASALRGQ
jgi:putative ABC transport system permease protein